MKRQSSPIVVTPPAGRAAVDRAELAEDVAVADDELGRLAGVLQVLRRVADRGELENLVVAAERGRAIHDGMRADPGSRADPHVRADECKRPDFDTLGDLGSGTTIACGSIKA